ncbi:hypothetical protein F5B21DRAFT_506596 [Xylaria acuta]|nr:hypothetical protein F5B21DRAFT_506596 [Xylaria acuta]
MPTTPFTEYKLGNQPLGNEKEIPPSLTDCKDNADRTAYVVNALRKYEQYARKNIIRPIQLKQVWEHGIKQNAKLNLSRGERERATAWYLFEEKNNKQPCQQCQARNSKGPFVECVAAADNIATGACFNNYYSGTSRSCSIRQDHENQKTKGQTPSKPKLDNITQATWRELDGWENQITAEQAARGADKAASMQAVLTLKRRRGCPDSEDYYYRLRQLN